jgi:hypothetical protein
MYALIYLIWGNLSGTWKGKILASGIITSLIIGVVCTIFTDTSVGLYGLLIIVPLAFILGVIVSIYLLIGMLLNHLWNNRSSSPLSVSIYVLCGLYAISFLPVAAGIVYSIYLLIVLDWGMA